MRSLTANLVRILAIVVLLTSCGGPAVSAQSVVDGFTAAGLGVSNPATPEANANIPNSYTERLRFDIAEVAPDGGQVFVCDTKRNCDAIYAYFDALKALAGPYLYQSPSGTVVVQLNKGLPPAVAAQYEAVVKGLP